MSTTPESPAPAPPPTCGQCGTDHRTLPDPMGATVACLMAAVAAAARARGGA